MYENQTTNAPDSAKTRSGRAGNFKARTLNGNQIWRLPTLVTDETPPPYKLSESRTT